MEPEQTPHSDGDPAAGDGGLRATPDGASGTDGGASTGAPDGAAAAGDNGVSATSGGVATVGNGAIAGTPNGAAPHTVGHTASPVSAVLDTISAQVRALQTAPTLTLSDGELRTALIAAHRLTNQLEAATLHLVRALDDRPEAMPTCPAGKVAATFLVHALRVDPGTAARDVAAARRLDPDGAGVGVDTGSTDPAGGLDAAGMGLPEVGAALAAGDISRRHVDHAVGCLGRIDGDVLAHVDPEGIAGIQRVDEFLAEQARKHAPHVFRRLCTQLEEALNPDQGFDPKVHEKRYLHLGTDATGMLVGRFALSPADGLIVRNVLHALSKPIKPTPRVRMPMGTGRLRVNSRCATPAPRPNAAPMPWPTSPASPYAATLAPPTPTPRTPAPPAGPAPATAFAHSWLQHPDHGRQRPLPPLGQPQCQPRHQRPHPQRYRRRHHRRPGQRRRSIQHREDHHFDHPTLAGPATVPRDPHLADRHPRPTHRRPPPHTHPRRRARQ
ncbi:MAG: DUF222 domain-containing protein [Kineosporiaceae bacterium]